MSEGLRGGIDLPEDRPGGFDFELPPNLTRHDLPRLLIDRGLVGVGAEVGVKEGEFSDFLLLAWPGRRLISIDSWQPVDRDSYQDIANVSQSAHDRFLANTRARLAAHGQRSEIWQMMSAEAAERLSTHSLDFVYLDARHDYDSVLEDLDLWFEKVRPGGILAGHDYLDGARPQGLFGVKSAVDEFFSRRGLRVYSTEGDAPWPSWIVFKPTAPDGASGQRESSSGTLDGTPNRDFAHIAADLARPLRTVLRRAVHASLPNEMADAVRRLDQIESALANEVNRATQLAALNQRVFERLEYLETQLTSLAQPSIEQFGLFPGQQRTIYRAESGSNPRRAICSLATGQFIELLGIGAASFEAYARRWNWDLVLSTERLAGDRPEPWGKIPFIQNVLREYDLVLWLDADTIIVDTDVDISELVEPNKDLYLVEHALEFTGETRAANTGVMMLRAGPWTESLLAQVWQNEEFVHHPWWENAALLDVLGYEIDMRCTSRLIEPGEMMARVKLIDHEWNSLTHRHVAAPRVVHHGGLPIAERRRLLLNDLVSFRRRFSAAQATPDKLFA